MVLHVQKVESARSLPSQLEPHKRYVSNHLTHVQIEVIKTKFQVIKNCRESLEGLVSDMNEGFSIIFYYYFILYNQV